MTISQHKSTPLDLSLNIQKNRVLLKKLVVIRDWLKDHEWRFILLCTIIGAISGLMVVIIHGAAVLIQTYLFSYSPEAVNNKTVAHVSIFALLALPVGGAIIGFLRHQFPQRSKAAIDVVEANALYGGHIPFRDSLLLCVQNIISNGFGASVGLEAAYAQAGGGFGSQLGRILNLRRFQMRTLVSAGAGAAIAAAFGAPLAGAFYAFEIVLGGYSVASLAPIVAATLSGVFVARLLDFDPFVLVSVSSHSVLLSDYFIYGFLGLICASFGYVLIKTLEFFEDRVKKISLDDRLKPVLGGFILIPFAFVFPHILGSGHAAMALSFDPNISVSLLFMILVAKALASVISISFGFRGGLFFASLFIGALLGACYGEILNQFNPALGVDSKKSALVGMAAFGVTIIGGPMTLSLLVLEITNDFALSTVVFTAVLVSHVFFRDTLGIRFATFRLHLRGENVQNARDVGWMRSLNASHLMRPVTDRLFESQTIRDLRQNFSLSATPLIFLTTKEGRYRGIVFTPEAYIDQIDLDLSVAFLSRQENIFITPDMDIMSVRKLFKRLDVDDLAVIDEAGILIGYVSENDINQRYVDELERTQKDFFGEN